MNWIVEYDGFSWIVEASSTEQALTRWLKAENKADYLNDRLEIFPAKAPCYELRID